MSENRSASKILDDAVAVTGWNKNSQVDVLLEYIERQDNHATFADYIAESAQDEVEDRLIDQDITDEDGIEDQSSAEY